jgi:phosphoribosylaminoimidazole-succinocarboxamide synthase
MRLIRTGKVKEVYEIDENTLEFVFSDNISVFDKVIPSSIPQKGETLCRTAEFWFRLLEKEGFRTHFVERTGKNRMKVKRFRIIEDYDKITTSTSDYLIPLEIICRHYAAGSLIDRVRSGKIGTNDLGFDIGHEIIYGDKLPSPYLEATTKLEAHDRELDESEAKDIAGLTDGDHRNILDTVLDIDRVMQREVSKRNLIHVDGKKEFGYNEKRELVLIDTLGTLDEDRWWDSVSYAEGKAEELSKEFVRQHYRETGYHAKLMEARENGTEEPDIPALPPDVIERVSALYTDMFERITGTKF